jgi:hypothetical protein
LHFRAKRSVRSIALERGNHGRGQIAIDCENLNYAGLVLSQRGEFGKLCLLARRGHRDHETQIVALIQVEIESELLESILAGERQIRLGLWVLVEIYSSHGLFVVSGYSAVFSLILIKLNYYF